MQLSRTGRLESRFWKLYAIIPASLLVLSDPVSDLSYLSFAQLSYQYGWRSCNTGCVIISLSLSSSAKKYSSLEVVFIALRILFSNALVKAFSGEVRFPVRRPLLIFWLKCGAQMHKDDIYWRYVLRRLPTYSKNVTIQEIVVIMVRAAKKENDRG